MLRPQILFISAYARETAEYYKGNLSTNPPLQVLFLSLSKKKKERNLCSPAHPQYISKLKIKSSNVKFVDIIEALAFHRHHRFWPRQTRRGWDKVAEEYRVPRPRHHSMSRCKGFEDVAKVRERPEILFVWSVVRSRLLEKS